MGKRENNSNLDQLSSKSKFRLIKKQKIKFYHPIKLLIKKRNERAKNQIQCQIQIYKDNLPDQIDLQLDENSNNDLQKITYHKDKSQPKDDIEQQLTQKSQTSQQQNTKGEENIQQVEDFKQQENNYHCNNQQISNFSSNLQFSKIKIGLPNLGLTCYINSAVQQLRQLYYIDQRIFGSSEFGKYFIDLFNNLQNGNKKLIYQKMEDIVGFAKQQQKHLQGGDAYMCIYNFLNEINESLSPNQKLEFNNNFLLKYCDQLECLNCDKKIKNTDDSITFLQYEEYGQECINLSQAFSNQGNQSLFQEINPYITCNTCQQRNFYTRREYQVAPKFIMIRLLQKNQYDSQYCSDNLLEQQFNLFLQGQIFPYQYQIIGFCSHHLYHYKYFAKYDTEWIEFDDSQTYFVYPNCNNALYYVLKKQDKSQIQRFEEACKILHYLKVKQYIIPVIQTMIQIYYFFDKNFLDQSAAQNDIELLIELLQEQNIENIQIFFDHIYMKIDQNNLYLEFQEAYLYFCDFLSEVMGLQASKVINKFETNFITKYIDQFTCPKCLIKQETQQISTLEQQEIYYQMLYGDNLSNDNIFPTNYLFKNCSKCNLGYQEQKRIYKQIPNFIIINKSFQELDECFFKKINQIFNLSLKDMDIQSYQIIGFCSYHNKEYYYTAKYKDEWIELKKKSTILKNPNCSNIQYFVLKKQIQN